MNEPKPLKRALVTVAAVAWAKRFARQWPADGLHVIVHAGPVQSTDAGRCRGCPGGSAEAVSFDVTNRVATAEALEAMTGGGPIQVLVNNAGIHDDAVFPGMSGDQWNRAMCR